MTDRAGVAKALKRLQVACVHVSAVLDAGNRDPRWGESQELEEAALEYGRALRRAGAVDNLRTTSEGD